MKNTLPQKLIKLAEVCPSPLYVVGGTCRDYIAGLRSDKSDLDICSPMTTDKIVALAESVGISIVSVYKNTGTVKLMADGIGYEFTSFRSDKYVRGKHNPASIYFTDDITRDALRRDFRCNAVYYNIVAGQFVDPLGGIDDINNKKLSTVAPANKVFGEDGLRLMRLCRQAAEINFTPTDDCIDGARQNSSMIDDISAERVWGELHMILLADSKYGMQYAQYKGLKLLNKIGVLPRIIPELAAGDGMAQRKDFHDHDVLEHSLRTVMYADKSIRLAALLHDVGKPKCFNETGKFIQHDIEGEILANNICKRLKVPTKTRERVATLTRLHLYDINCLARGNKVRKFIVNHYDIIPELLLIKQADFSACKDNLSVAPCVEKWQKIIDKMKAEGAPFTVKQLAVKGDELIKIGLPPELTATTLKYLLTECAMNAQLNNKEKLIKLALNYHGRK